MTAYATGTASDNADLFSKLIAFLTTNSDLVSASQAWTSVWTGAGDAKVLKGPGLGGTDEIFVGFDTVSDTVNNRHSILMYGMTGIVPSATLMTGHVNVQPGFVRFYADNSPMTYWFVASGRRFAGVVKISTVFEAFYGGLFLPYADPDTYGYPYFIGGTAGPTISGNPDWRSSDVGHSHFVSSYYSPPNPVRDPSAWMLDPLGQWLPVINVAPAGRPSPPLVHVAPQQFGFADESSGFYVMTNPDAQHWGTEFLRQQQATCPGGNFPLTPLTLVQQLSSDQTFGVLDGCYNVPGQGNSSENTVTIGGVVHLVVQNVFRTGVGDYWALALE